MCNLQVLFCGECRLFRVYDNKNAIFGILSRWGPPTVFIEAKIDEMVNCYDWVLYAHFLYIQYMI